MNIDITARSTISTATKRAAAASSLLVQNSYPLLRHLPALFAVASLTAATFAEESKRLLQPEDVAALRNVSDPQLSPDGKFIVYTVESTDLVKDKASLNLWLASWDGSENRALTFGSEKQSHPRWSPDGKSIAFLSKRADEHENDQIWLLPSAGGEVERLTDLKGGVSDFAWSPDAKRLVLVVKDPDPRDPEGHKKDQKTVPPLVIDRYQFKQDIDGYLTDGYAHLSLLDLATHKIEPLTNGKGHDDLLPSWSPSGKEIVFVTKRGDDPDRTENWDLYVIPAQSGAKESQLTTASEVDDHPTNSSAPAWSPDGRFIAYLHGAAPRKTEYGVTTLAVIPSAGGKARVLTPALDRNVFQPRWSPDGSSIYVLVEDDREQSLQRVPFQETSATPELVLGGRREVTVYSSANDHVAVSASTAESPFEIYAVEQSNVRDLSKQNDAFLDKVRLATTQETEFRSPDGTQIHGFLVRALDLPTNQPGPALLRLHGVPNHSTGMSLTSKHSYLPRMAIVSSCPTHAVPLGAGKTSA